MNTYMKVILNFHPVSAPNSGRVSSSSMISLPLRLCSVSDINSHPIAILPRRWWTVNLARAPTRSHRVFQCIPTCFKADHTLCANPHTDTFVHVQAKAHSHSDAESRENDWKVRMHVWVSVMLVQHRPKKEGWVKRRTTKFFLKHQNG